jgi:hypothetical protein
MRGVLTIEHAREQWSSKGVYLNTASYGLPPRAGFEAMWTRSPTGAAGAGWYAGADVHKSCFGPPLRLAADARRFDTSPAWFSWVGAQPALELLNPIGVSAEHDVALAHRFRAGLGLDAGNSGSSPSPGG